MSKRNTISFELNSYWGAKDTNCREAAGMHQVEAYHSVSGGESNYHTMLYSISNSLKKRKHNKGSYDAYASTIIPNFSAYATFDEKGNLKPQTVSKDDEKLNFGFQARLTFNLLDTEANSRASCSDKSIKTKPYYIDLTLAQIGHQKLMSVVAETVEKDAKCIEIEAESDGGDKKCDKKIVKSIFSALDKIDNDKNHWLIATQTQAPNQDIFDGEKRDDAQYFTIVDGGKDNFKRSNIMYYSDGSVSSQYSYSKDSGDFMGIDAYLVYDHEETDEEKNIKYQSVDNELMISVTDIFKTNRDNINIGHDINQNNTDFFIKINENIHKRLCNINVKQLELYNSL